MNECHIEEVEKIQQSIERARAHGEKIITEKFRSVQNDDPDRDVSQISLEDATCIATGLNDYIQYMIQLERRLKEWHAKHCDSPVELVLAEDFYQEASNFQTDTAINTANNEIPTMAENMKCKVIGLETALDERMRQYQLIKERMRELELQGYMTSQSVETDSSIEPNTAFERLLVYSRSSSHLVLTAPKVSKQDPVEEPSKSPLFQMHHLYVRNYQSLDENDSFKAHHQYNLRWPELLLMDPQCRESPQFKHTGRDSKVTDVLPRIVFCVAVPSGAEKTEKLLFTIPSDQPMVIHIQEKWNSLTESIAAQSMKQTNDFRYACSSVFYDALFEYVKGRKNHHSFQLSKIASKVFEVHVGPRGRNVHENGVDLTYNEYEGLYWIELPFMQSLYEALTSCGDVVEVIDSSLNFLHHVLTNLR